MVDIKMYINSLFNAKNILIPTTKQNLLDEFVRSVDCQEAVNSIIENQNFIMEKWKIKNRVADIISHQIVIPNGTIGKHYEAKIDFNKLNFTDLLFETFEGLEELGLSFNKVNSAIEGTPTQSGDFKIKLIFKIKGESESTSPNEKLISLIINPDPKSLWKDIPSDTNDLFWKKDDVTEAASLGDRHIVVASKRGRSHENVGSFRDDDFAYKYFEKTGWSVVAVSDGAGSYSLSRIGSQLACNAVLDYFENHHDVEQNKEFESKLIAFNESKDEMLLKEIEIASKQNLYKATLHVHNKIKEHAEITSKEHPELFNNPKAKTLLDYYHSTLIFALFKKYEFGYVLQTFGVGDCPIAIMNKDQSQTTLLNWLDVGEFGGGTRFITQPNIFHSKEHPMASRFNFQIVTDFSYLFLMTDGIYDPKFVVEANLEKNGKWIEFMEDLQGNNEDNLKVDFDYSNTEISNQLSNWMDFWSQGNHDDRTLAIVY
ncbi:MAG: PP2C family serine/threonine-protein phosphatase [Algoriphagus sp.]|uniref:PP2C family serine/threonine-protein phosphatase n=1 Tax=Algoriphagus sp. TaxID=1872435 RepID=UPI0026056274|nr:PP2C family serine/threonine-protein phosphatase [Algoriphagus sp.]MDG1276477.1 PP2C family serine/threonine-protein phosphatase [Algoriphagus sp.]